MPFTQKDLSGYLKITADTAALGFGMPTYNDVYNLARYGITAATYYQIQRALIDRVGSHGPRPRTVAQLRMFLKG